MRKKEYMFYATSRGGDFTTRSEAYSRGTHPWIYAVCATSISQAYTLGKKEVFATDAKAVGVRQIEKDWWHGGCDACTRQSGCPEHRIRAPYLKGGL